MCVDLGHINLLLPTILGFLNWFMEPHTPAMAYIMGYNIMHVQGS